MNSCRQYQKKHILMITTSFPDNRLHDGQEAAGSFVSDFAEELSRHVTLTVVAPGCEDLRTEADRITIRRFAVPSLPLSLLKPTVPSNWTAILTTLRSGQRAVRHAVQEQPPDHIFALWALPSGYWAQRATERRGIPFSIWALGSDIWSLGKIPGIAGILKSVLRNAHKRFADGYLLADNVNDLSGQSCLFLPSTRKLPSVPRREFKSDPPYNLAFLGRWHPNKGVDLLLESLALLPDRDWDKIAGVKIHGGGPLSEMVHDQTAALQADGRPIEAGGYLDRQQAAQLLQWADYLLLPSRIESIPVIYSDAMQAQCPLVSTPIGDLPRLMSSFDVGILSRSANAGSFAKAIGRALETPPSRFSDGISASGKEFNLESIAPFFLQNIFASTS